MDNVQSMFQDYVIGGLHFCHHLTPVVALINHPEFAAGLCNVSCPQQKKEKNSPVDTEKLPWIALVVEIFLRFPDSQLQHVCVFMFVSLFFYFSVTFFQLFFHR